MKYLTEEKFEQEVEALRLREFGSFKDEMLGFKTEMFGFKDEMFGFKDEMKGFTKKTERRLDLIEYELTLNRKEHTELKEMIQQGFEKVFRLFDRDAKMYIDLTQENVAAHRRIDRVEKYLGPAFQKTLTTE